MKNANGELSWMEGDEREEDNLEILMGDGGRLDLMHSFMRKVITCLVIFFAARANSR